MERITIGELRRMLAPLSLTRRKAVMFCLETKAPATRLLTLTWQEVFRMNLTPIAQAIVRSMPRHLSLPNVFWEYVAEVDGLASPLFGLEKHLRVAAGVNLARLQVLYDRLIWVDEDAELKVFQVAMRETLAGL